MKNKHILLVEDEPFLAKVIKDSLEQHGYQVSHAADGKKAYNLFQNEIFSICIVDVMLPFTDGFTLVRQIRNNNKTVPVIFLTAKNTTDNVIEGYQSGGNDYLKKPFSLEELFLRITELLKRNDTNLQQAEERLQIGELVFIPQKMILLLPQKEEIRLSHRESSLLLLLYQDRHVMLERKKALLTLWGDDSFYHTRTMDVFITKIRKHLNHDPLVKILNIRGIGYKLIC